MEDGYYWIRPKKWRPDVPPVVAEYEADLGWEVPGDWRPLFDDEVTVLSDRLEPPKEA